MENRPLTFTELVKELEDENWGKSTRCSQEQWPIPDRGWGS